MSTDTADRTLSRLIRDARKFRPTVRSIGGSQPGVRFGDAHMVAQAAAAFLSDHGAYDLMGQGGDTTPGPVLYGPGFHADGYVIGYEGDYEWTIRFTEHLFAARLAHQQGEPVTDKAAALLALTDHLHIECLNGWALAVYPH